MNNSIKATPIRSWGNPASKFVVVGESPSAIETLPGRTFSGESWKYVMDKLPKDLDILYVNAIPEIVPRKDPQVVLKYVEKYKQSLWDILTEYPRETIVALGSGALWALTNNYDLRITAERGRLIKSNWSLNGIIPCLHPAYVLRGGGSAKKFEEDIAMAIALHYKQPIKAYIEPTTYLITPKNVNWVKAEIRKVGIVASDIETGGLNRQQDRILTTGFCWKPSEAWICPPELIREFKDIMEDTSIKWIWHNGKFDIAFLRRDCIWARVDEDTMLLNYCLDETRGVHDLDTVAKDILGAPNHKHVLDDWFESQGMSSKNRDYSLIPFDILFSYQGKDLSKTLQIWQQLRPLVKQDAALDKLYTCTLLPASELLYYVEARGFAFNWEAWEANKVRLTEHVNALAEEINCIVGRSINPGSSKQVCAYVYDELKIKSKGKRSSGKKAVARWPNIPFKKALSDWRVASKALSTYIIGLAKHVHEDNRIYPTFLLHGTRTGRLACREPNLQNIPRDARLKGMFRASPGYILLDLDASQAELRSLAIQSGDPDLLAIYNSTDRSLHKETAVYRYGPDYDEEEYTRAKAVNFGVIYGRTAASLADEFKIPVEQAQAEIDSFWAQFPVAKAFQDRCRAAPLKKQTIVTIFGRKCRPGMINAENKDSVQNEFANFPHQSTASDITIHVAILIRPLLEALGAYIVNLVHDSIVVECPNDPAIIAEVKQLGLLYFPKVAKEWGLTKAPFISECKMCYSWGTNVKEIQTDY